VAGGSLWGLDAAKGTLLWRRAIGGGCWARLGSSPDSDIVAIDGASSEVVRLSARSGGLKWRRSIPGLLMAAPCVLGGQVIVPTDGGLLVALGAASGQTKAAAQLPLPASAAPVAAAGQVLVAADGLYLIRLDPGDLSAKSAVCIGHEPGSASVSPVALPRSVVVAENRGAASAVLHVIGDGPGVLQELPVTGCIVTPPVVIGPRLIVAADSGGVTVFDVTGDAKAPFKKTAELPPGGSAGYLAEQGGKLLVAGAGLKQIAFAGKDLAPGWTAFQTARCLAPPQVVGESVFCVRREPGSPTAIAAALRAASGQPVWETKLALPEAAP